MLRRSPLSQRVRADMSRLPFVDGLFDLVVSGLAVGHAPRLDEWMREMARVLAPGGHLVYSDFHPDAVRAGMTRSFIDGERRKHTLLHSLYDLPAHQAAAAAAGLELELCREVRVGHELREPFEGAAEFYRRWHGLALVLALRMRKASA
jgi:malonyl-CoA O-methyltransferase